MSIPALGVIFFRWFLHSCLGLRLGFLGITDYDFIFPMPLSFMAWFWAIDRSRPLKIKFRPKIGFVHLGFAVLFLALNLFLYWRIAPFESWIMSIWWLVFVLMFSSGFLIWIGFDPFLYPPNVRAMFPALVACFGIVIVQNYGELFWPLFSRVLERGLELILPFKVVRSSAHVILAHPELTLRIGVGCSGLDGFLFFASTFLLVMPFAGGPHREEGWSWLKIFIFGIFFQCFLNFLRIGLLFLAGLVLVRGLGATRGMPILMNIFHVHLGYLLYVMGLVSFFACVFHRTQRSLSEKSTKSRKQLLENFHS